MRVVHRFNRTYLGFAPQVFAKWTPSLAVWGGVVGFAAVFILEPVPRIRNILAGVPVIGSYWIREIDPNDSPF
ncbi:cytochrome b-c1 complex subunit 10 [Lipomyces oligophaga]|uniref:cytochrome b-c1 complex subunit 10 n=1 Tax=Lipomyces oligophaga TaxID=45792 RepID=UPI0034CE6F02